MSKVYQPVLHALSGTWYLGIIEDHRARPLMREEIDAVIVLLEEKQQLGRIEHKLDLLLNKESLMDADVQNLVTQVATLKTVDASALALINGIAAQIAAAVAAAGSLSADDRTALEGAISDITSQDTALAAAVTANTPAAPSGGTSTPPPAS